MELSEGTIYGARYYTAKPGWNQNWLPILDWCAKAFGPIADVWDKELGRWYANNGKFWFRKESDRVLFLMRWS
jgi:hypothetical protein